MLVHTVYFWLKSDLTPAQRAEFRTNVETLGTIPSVSQFFCGNPAGVPDRPIIDKSFSVAITVVCKNVAAHDAYQVDPIHLTFIAKSKAMWERVQIYDAE
jgi:Stress responsive A/B Barrel Domain